METGMEKKQKNILFTEVARYLGYAALAFFVAEFLRWNASIDNSEAKFPELSFVEYAQSLLLIVCGLISFRFFLSKAGYSHRHIFMLIAALCAMALIREQDMHFETFVGDGTWPIPIVAILAVVIYKIFRVRKFLLSEIVSFMKNKSYGFFVAATITIFVFSRLFGRTVFWEAVMEDQYFRSVKNVAEESLELYGYLLLLMAVVELAIGDHQAKEIKKGHSTRRKVEKTQRQFVTTQ
jgi:hypothetical protein